MPLVAALLAKETTMIGFDVNPDNETVVHDTPVTVVEPYFTLNGSRTASSVPEVMFFALTGLPEPLVPKENVVAALTASLGLSRARKRNRKGLIMVASCKCGCATEQNVETVTKFSAVLKTLLDFLKSFQLSA